MRTGRMKTRMVLLGIPLVIGIFFSQMMFIHAGSVEGLKIQITSDWPGRDGKGVFRLYNSPSANEANIIARVDVIKDWNGEVTYNVIAQQGNYNMVQVQSPRYGKPWIYIGDGNGATNGKGYRFIKSGSQSNPRPSGSKLLWPVPSSSQINSCWGDQRNHLAIDIGADNGSQVKACASGKILQVVGSCTHNYAKTSRCCGNGYGKYVVMQSEDATVKKIQFNHLSAINSNIRAGTRVKAGDSIGSVGSTGYSNGYHLDLEFFNSAGNKIVPTDYLEIPRDIHANPSSWQCCKNFVAQVRKKNGL